MKKYKNLTIGGIENKVFNLILITVILMVAVFVAVSLRQSAFLENLSAKTSAAQQEETGALTTEVMDQVARRSMESMANRETKILDVLFSSVRARVTLLAEYAEAVFANPDSPRRAYSAPDLAMDGQLTAHVLIADGVEETEIADRLGVAAGLSDVMISLCDAFNTDGIYVGLAEGAFLRASREVSGWFVDGELKSYDPRTRDWYIRAAEAGGLIFNANLADAATDEFCVECAMPVYGPDGTLRAVVGADLYRNEIESAMQGVAQDGTYRAVIDENGHVIYSPNESVFQAYSNASDKDLRESENRELAALVTRAMEGRTGVELVTLGDNRYYMMAQPMESVGWILLSAYSQEAIDQPVVALRATNDRIQREAADSYREQAGHAKTTTIVLLAVLLVLALGGAMLLGKRIVKPLNTMTRRIASISEENPEFRMEDAYRTGDEVEALAESFAALSHRTVQYVEEVQRVTAEKERINSELTMAKEIQGSQLPRIFPPYPDNPHFDLYASMIPAREVGGDFYDFFMVDGDHLAMVMADVSGKGVPAALFMMIAKTLIKNRLQSGENLEAVLANVNNQLMEGNAAGMFVTAWVGVLTVSTGEGVAVNAGHEHPILKRAGGKFELIRYRHSLSMAVMENARFHAHRFELHPGDTLFVYTDGVMEATNRANELMGEQRMLDALNSDPDADPKAMLDHMKQAIDAFVDGAEQFDDITMMGLKYNG